MATAGFTTSAAPVYAIGIDVVAVALESTVPVMVQGHSVMVRVVALVMV